MAWARLSSRRFREPPRARARGASLLLRQRAMGFSAQGRTPARVPPPPPARGVPASPPDGAPPPLRPIPPLLPAQGERAASRAMFPGAFPPSFFPVFPLLSAPTALAPGELPAAPPPCPRAPAPRREEGPAHPPESRAGAGASFLSAAVSAPPRVRPSSPASAAQAGREAVLGRGGLATRPGEQARPGGMGADLRVRASGAVSRQACRSRFPFGWRPTGTGFPDSAEAAPWAIRRIQGETSEGGSPASAREGRTHGSTPPRRASAETTRPGKGGSGAFPTHSSPYVPLCPLPVVACACARRTSGGSAPKLPACVDFM